MSQATQASTQQGQPAARPATGNGAMSETDMLKARIAELERQLNGQLSVVISRKTGSIVVRGLGAHPVSLYATQWERLIPFIPKVNAFLAAQQGKYAIKGKEWTPPADTVTDPVYSQPYKAE